MSILRWTLALAPLAVVLASPAGARPEPTLRPLLDAAAERLLTAQDVAASKWQTGGAITDPVRVGQVLDAVTADAAARGLDQNYVRQIFTDQIDATEGVEYALFADWSFDPTAAPAQAPDLAASRAVIDRLNRVMVEELASGTSILRSPQCQTEVQTALDEVSARRTLDPLYRRALTAATRHYCPDR